MKPKNRNKLKQKVLERVERKVVGYHVYRAEKESLPFMFWQRITDEPIPEGTFNDQPDEHGKRYFYKLTQVFDDGKESRPTAAQSTFTDHAGNTYRQNPLKDFVGYNMYRSADETVPLDRWEKRNAEPIPTTTYKDEGVESGEVYFYYVRAVDSTGKESAPGEIFRVVRA